MSKLLYVSLHQIMSAEFLPNIILIDLQLKSYHKNNTGELF